MNNLLTVHEVAIALRVDDTTVRRWIKAGALKAIALPHARTRQGYRIKQETLDDLFDGSALDLAPAPEPQPATPRHYVKSHS